MALFGTDMVDVQTPDGRRLTVPAQLAAQFPGLQPVPPQNLGPSLGGAAPGPLRPVPEIAAAPAQPTPSPGPITAPSQSAADGSVPVPPRGPVTSPTQVPEPGPPNAPRPLTDAELANRGLSAGLQQSDSALEEKRRAVDTISAQQQDEAKRQAEIQEEANQKSHAALEKAAADATKAQADLDKMMTDRDAAVKKIADTKVDHGSDHPILAGIGLVLGAIGTAMNNRSAALSAAFLGQAAPTPQQNPAIAAFYQAIDRKVQAQMDNIAKGRLDVAAMGQQIDMKQQLVTNRAGVANTLRAAALEQANRDIEALKTRLGGDAAKANATSLQADISMKQATLRNEAAQQAHTNQQTEQARKDQLQMHRESLGVQYAGQAQSERHFNKTFEEQKRQFDIKEANDLKAVQLAHPGKVAAASAAALKENEERAIGDPANGSWLLQPEGVKAQKEAEGRQTAADKFRALADKEQDPNKRTALGARADAEAQKAAELRIEASATGTWRVGKDERKEISSLAATAQTIGSTADEIKLLRQKYNNEFTSSAAKAEMQEKSTALLMYLKNAWKLGVLSGSDAEYIETATGGDPSKLTASDVSSLFGSPDKAARLDALVSGVEQMTRNELKAKGFRGEFKLRRDEAANLTPEGQAAADALRSPTPGEEIQGAGGRAFDAIDPRNTGAAIWGEGNVTRRRERAAEAKATGKGDTLSVPGLNDTQAKAVEANILAYKQNVGSTDEASQSRAKKAADTLIGLASSDRQSLSSAVLDALGEHAPELQQQAVARLPKPVAAARAGRERTILEGASVGILKQNALGGDEASKQELGRRAVAGDKDAVRAVSDLINARKVR